MQVQKVFSPFDKKIEIQLVDWNCDPVLVSSLADVEVVLCINRTPQLKFNKAGGTGWRAWSNGPGATPTSVICQVTKDDTNLWRGLLTAEVVQVENSDVLPNNEQNDPPREVVLNLVSKSSGFTTWPSPDVNPIGFTLAFSCDRGSASLTITAEANAPNGNYVLQILIEGIWRRLYKGYIEVTNGVGDANGTGTFTAIIPKTAQIAAGSYPVRLLNDGSSPLTTANGATSDMQDIYIVDCWQGELRMDNDRNAYLNRMGSVWGWY